MFHRMIQMILLYSFSFIIRYKSFSICSFISSLIYFLCLFVSISLITFSLSFFTFSFFTSFSPRHFLYPFSRFYIPSAYIFMLLLLSSFPLHLNLLVVNLLPPTFFSFLVFYSRLQQPDIYYSRISLHFKNIVLPFLTA